MASKLEDLKQNSDSQSSVVLAAFPDHDSFCSLSTTQLSFVTVFSLFGLVSMRDRPNETVEIVPRKMKFRNLLSLILSTSAVLGFTTATIADKLPVANSSTSAQQKTPSPSQEYSFTFNRQPEVAYSNTLPNGNQYLPLFPVLEAMGAEYKWDRSQNTVFISHGENTVELQPGERVATRNGYPLAIPSKVADGTVWIYARELPRLPGIDHVPFDGSEQQLQVYDFQEPTDRQTLLEKAAADLIQDYLAMDLEQRATLLSPDKEISDPSYDPEEPELPAKDIEIKSAVQLTSADNLNQGLVKVVARYTTDYDGQSEYEFIYNVPGETIQETTFIVRANDNKVAIDNVTNYRANRTGTGAPIPLLEEEDYIEIAREWQRMNPDANDEDLSSIIDDFVEPTLAKIDIRYGEELNEEVLARFSEEVKQSKGWHDFRSLEGAKDPFYNILEATYDGQVLSATLLGNWVVNSVSLTPILLEIELVKEDNAWKFTRLANVRLHQNARELEVNEPETYSKIARFISYQRDLGIVGSGLFI